MKKALIALFVSTSVFSNTGTDVLLKDFKGQLVGKNVVKMQKQIILDNPFLVQLYGSYKTSFVREEMVNNYFDLIFAKKYDQAINLFSKLDKYESKYKGLINASKLFVLWELNYPQTFFNSWLENAAKDNFLNTELGVAFDQYISKNTSNWLIKNGIVLSSNQKDMIDSISENESNFNYSVQALRHLKDPKETFKRMSFLRKNDPLLIPMAKTVVIDFARKNELAKAAKLIKEVYEPIINKSEDTEEISDYYMVLARLLYQAKAYKESQQYYDLVPDESRNFLQAKVENLWLSMRSSDLPTLKGHVKSLEFKEFKDEFLPELQLVSSMANLQTCQFDAVKNSFKRFVNKNAIMAKEISSSLASDTPNIVRSNFYTDLLERSKEVTKNEVKKLSALNDEVFAEHATLNLKNKYVLVDEMMNTEARLQWLNRKKILEVAIKNMRFVKIEYLSTMRRLKSKLALMKKQDSISYMQAARQKSNQVKFPYDGIVFGDELFNYSSDIKNLCLQGKR